MTFEELEKKVIEWGEERGLYHPTNGTNLIAQYDKLNEEFGELGEAIHVGTDWVDVEDAIGDMMVVLTHIARLAGLDLFRCYAAAYLQIKDRKGKMINGIFVKES